MDVLLAGDTKDFVPEPGLGFQPESRRHRFDKQEGLAEVPLLEANLAAIQVSSSDCGKDFVLLSGMSCYKLMVG